MYQKRILPYFIIPSTFSPQASSPLERSRQTEGQTNLNTPRYLSSFFFPLSARGPTRRRNSTGLAELWGGWPIELGTTNMLEWVHTTNKLQSDLLCACMHRNQHCYLSKPTACMNPNIASTQPRTWQDINWSFDPTAASNMQLSSSIKRYNSESRPLHPPLRSRPSSFH